MIRSARAMRNVALGALALSFLAACGDVAGEGPAVDASIDTSIPPPDGSSTVDAAVGHDAGNTVDATAEDASDAGEVVDAVAYDAGADAPHDAAIDNDPRCPPTFGATGACTIDGVTCRYPQGRCDCERPCSGVFIPDAGWSCTAYTAPCPDNPPVKGSACATEGAHCVYPGCCTVNDFTCGNGKWDAKPPFCPP